MATIQRFNGGLFHFPDVIPLSRDQIDLPREAASSDWRYVEPAIFGTLLERALDPRERHQLGAHYTPRPRRKTGHAPGPALDEAPAALIFSLAGTTFSVLTFNRSLSARTPLLHQER
jgi:hypothetical protein